MSDNTFETMVETPGESRALTIVGGADDRSHTSPIARDAGFLAQLIATKVQCPQARQRRRAEPEEAVVTYQLSLAAVHQVGQTFALKS